MRETSEVEAADIEDLELSTRSRERSRRQSTYYSQALPLARAVGDRVHGSHDDSVTSAWNLYDALGEKQKALDYYNQALPLERAIGDRSREKRQR